MASATILAVGSIAAAGKPHASGHHAACRHHAARCAHSHARKHAHSQAARHTGTSTSLVSGAPLAALGSSAAGTVAAAPSAAGEGTHASAAVAAPSSGTELPSVTEIPASAGSHGYPYDAVPETPITAGFPSINLSGVGYAQREFRMSGGANIFRQSGNWGGNGEWNVAVSQANVPYTTRILVRYPTDPAKFNGTVVFEWLNDTTGGDQDPVWSELYGTLIKHGYAYVGVTAQKPGMEDLVEWDPSRYAGLGDSNDGQSYEIFSQAAQVVKADSATLLGGLTPKELIGTGDSQSAFRVDTYVNAIQPISHAFNGFLAVGRAVNAAPIGEGLLALSPWAAHIRTNNTAPFIELNTQGDIEELDAGVARQADNNDLRTWEVTGAAHIDAHEAEYEISTLAREKPEQPVPSCVGGTPTENTGTPIDGHNQPDNMPLYQVEQAAIGALQNWVVNGVAPPHATPIQTYPAFFGLFDFVNKNKYGVGYGGIRMPDAQVPTENYSAINLSTGTLSLTSSPWSLFEELEAAFKSFQTGGIQNESLREAGLCLLSGYFTNLSQSTLSSMYPTKASYTSQIKAAANADVAAGFMTPEGAEKEIMRAEVGVGPLQDPPLTWPTTE